MKACSEQMTIMEDWTFHMECMMSSWNKKVMRNSLVLLRLMARMITTVKLA